MRTRTQGDGEKQRSIRERHREKERRRYGREGGGSSEDVWRSREGKVAAGEAFRTPFPEVRESDEEWNRGETVRRERMREGVEGGRV